MSYVLKKLEILEGSYSAVGVGRSITGALHIVQVSEEDPRIMLSATRDSLEDVQVGTRIVVSRLADYIVTSTIQKILERAPESVTFETTTSVYLLTKGEADE